MKRYRVLLMDFDTRATILSHPIGEDWEPQVRAQWQQNKAMVAQGLVAQYGPHGQQQKIQNFVDLGAAPFSVVAFHNVFYRQARDAFVMGAYYPALTGVCALGERVLNHLVIKLRDDFQGTDEYKRVHRKDSFDDWEQAIGTLEAWKVLLPEAAGHFRKLKAVRHRAIHFNPETERGARAIALDALKVFHQIVDAQFTAFGDRPWYIRNDTGVSFVRKAAEAEPFVSRVILPSCSLVGPAHKLENAGGGFVAVDPTEYPDREVSDEEYVELFKESQGRRPVPGP